MFAGASQICPQKQSCSRGRDSGVRQELADLLGEMPEMAAGTQVVGNIGMYFAACSGGRLIGTRVAIERRACKRKKIVPIKSRIGQTPTTTDIIITSRGGQNRKASHAIQMRPRMEHGCSMRKLGAAGEGEG